MPANEPGVIEGAAHATKKIRVLCADDHPLILDGVARSLEREPDLLLVAEATNGLEAIEAFRLHKPDVALVDLQMPELNGIEVIRQILKMNPRARCIVLTTYRGDVQATRAFKAGAVGYLLKTMLRKELAQAVRTVHAGSRYVPNEIASELTRYFSADDLSARELEVLRSVSQGRSNKIVADELAISEDTVKGHMRTILSKLGANDRLDAVMIALRRGILDG
jgi:DNA-binding NarL/FixJ family response regulator